MSLIDDEEIKRDTRMTREINLLSYPYRMFLAKAMEAHGCKSLLERLHEALSIIDTSSAFTDEEEKRTKKLLYCDAAEMINKFNKRCGG
jgi:hypothetical protein